MKKSSLIIPLVVMILVTDCMERNSSRSDNPDFNKLNDPTLLKAVLWHQTSAEYRALAYQAFNIASERIINETARGHQRKPAVVVDIDETILNNSFYNAALIERKLEYPEEFNNWISKSAAEPIPGALEFLDLANELGCEIFYLTNRRENVFEGTLQNLQKYNFPQADKEHLLMKEDVSSKEPRRERIASRYDVIMLLGDNLIDFTGLFDKGNIEERYSLVDSLRNYFGNKYIILPNAMHGNWLKALYDYRSDLTPPERLEIELGHIRVY
ncbi:MAG: 5'-nucleotidase, lipoprotein e(P4) family [Candidatus Cloacimonetes bacterium]|nr:5'-nucleotidase, lipoprotein e(P4) family [Candidatus Cloacimonadota bacterium]